jgi:hypothetical protein
MRRTSWEELSSRQKDQGSQRSFDEDRRGDVQATNFTRLIRAKNHYLDVAEKLYRN